MNFNKFIKIKRLRTDFREELLNELLQEINYRQTNDPHQDGYEGALNYLAIMLEKKRVDNNK